MTKNKTIYTKNRKLYNNSYYNEFSRYLIPNDSKIPISMSKKKGDGFTGKYGGLVHYYNKHGKQQQRPGGADAATYASLESMEVNRKNGTEFGFASHYSKLWRDSIAKYAYYLRPELHSELSKLFKLTMQTDLLHPAGKRSLDVRLYGTLFNNYSLSINDFHALVSMPVNLTTSEDRQQVQWSLPAFNPRELLTFPETANSFRLFMTASVINKYEYDETLNRYVPETIDEFVLTKVATTEKLYSYDAIAAQSLVVEFDFIPDPELIVIVCIGVQFSKVDGDGENRNPKWGGMKVAKVT